MSEKEFDFYTLGISDDAKKIYSKISEIYKDKVDTTLDFATLAIFSESCVRLKRCIEMTNNKQLFYQTANGSFTAHPLRDEISMHQKQIHYTSAKLGLTPDARHKIKMELAEMEHRKSNSKSGRKPNHKKTIEEQIAEDTEEFL